MREFMMMILSAQIFVMCISGALYFFSTELGIPFIENQGFDPATLADSYNATAQSYRTGAFDPLFIFGDFQRGITQFLDILTGGYVFSMMEKFGFAESFTVSVQAIFGLSTIMVLVYLISGRG